MLNRVTLQGRLTADPESRITNNNVYVTSFRLAVEGDYKDSNGERKSDFFNIVAWRGTAEFVIKHFRKGQMVIIEGKLQSRQYEDKNGITRYVTEVLAEHAYFAGSKPAEQKAEDTYDPWGAYNGPVDIASDDLPY